MTGIIKKLNRSEGVTVTAPTDLSVAITAEALLVFSSDGSFESNKGAAGEDGDLYYNSTTDVVRLHAAGVWTNVGAGGAGGINYVDQNTGRSTYADAADYKPVDGTGGTAILNATTNATDPLIGAQDVLLAKGSTGSQQGEGAAWTFAVDKAFSDNPKLFEISFYYGVKTGPFAYGDMNDPTNDPSDITVWIYDVDASQLIEPSTFMLTGAGEYRGTFQPNAGSTNYRLLLHISSTSTADWDLQIDELSVGPQVRAIGASMSDWVDFTPGDCTWGNSSASGRWRRVGDSIELLISDEFDGTIASNLLWSASAFLPSGLTIDSAKLTSGQGGNDGIVVGIWLATDNASQYYSGNVHWDISGSVIAFDLSESGIINTTTPITWTANDGIVAKIQLPITGWSANTVVSSEGESRVVAAYAKRITSDITLTGGAGYSTIVFNDKGVDTHDALNDTSGVFTVPTAGKYKISYSLGITPSTSTTRIESRIKAGGISYGYCLDDELTAGDGETLHGHCIAGLDAGNTIYIEASSTGANSDVKNSLAGWSAISIERLSGPTAIAASEVIVGKCYGTTTTASVSSGTPYYIKFDNEDIDTHGLLTHGAATGTTAFTNGTTFTAPTAGNYQINASIYAGAGTWGVSDTFEIHILKEDTITRSGLFVSEQTGATTNRATQISDIVHLNAGERIQIAGEITTAAGNIEILGNDRYNWLGIHRIGGVM